MQNDVGKTQGAHGFHGEEIRVSGSRPNEIDLSLVLYR